MKEGHLRLKAVLFSALVLAGLLLFSARAPKTFTGAPKVDQQQYAPSKPSRATSQSAYPSSRNGKRDFDPFQREERWRGTPRIGTSPLIASEIARKLDLADDELTQAQRAISLMRENIALLIGEKSQVIRDESKQSMLIQIGGFEEEADALLVALQESLISLLGEEKGAALFSYLDTQSEFSAFGRHTVTIDLQLEPLARPYAVRSEVYYRVQSSAGEWGGSGRFFSDHFNPLRLIGGYDQVFDATVGEYFSKFFAERKEERKREQQRKETARLEREKQAPPQEHPAPVPAPTIQTEFVEVTPPNWEELNQHQMDFHKRISNILTSRIQHQPFLSRPEEGYSVYSIRASEDFGAALKYEQRKIFVPLLSEASRYDLNYWTNGRFPYKSDILARDTIIEIRRDKDGKLVSSTYYQSDPLTGEFISSGSGESSDIEWLLREAGS